MRYMYGTALVCAAALGFSACAEAGTADAPLETDAQKASYGIGRDIGRNLKPAADSLSVDALMRGIRETLNDVEPALPQEEIRGAVQRFTEQVQEAQVAAQQAEAETNLAAGQEFLAGNVQNEGVTETESGLQYEVVEEGDGPSPDPEDEVTVHYEGKLLDGTVFDSSRERGEPATFALNGVIEGFSEGLQLMSEGATYRLWIPADLAYGEQGRPPTIPPNQTLIFELELLEVIEGDGAAQGGEGGG